MPKFFFDIESRDTRVDTVGTDLPGREHAKRDAVSIASELLRGHADSVMVGQPLRLHVRDEAGIVLMVLTIAAALG